MNETTAALLEAAKETNRLWQKYGLGEDHGESEQVYRLFNEAIRNADRNADPAQPFRNNGYTVEAAFYSTATSCLHLLRAVREYVDKLVFDHAWHPETLDWQTIGLLAESSDALRELCLLLGKETP